MDNKLMSAIKASIEKHPDDIEGYRDLFSLCREIEKEDFELAHRENRALRPLLDAGVKRSAYKNDFNNAEMFRDQYFKSLLFGAPHYFDDYLQAVEFNRPYAKKFYLPRRHYLMRYVSAYQEILDGKLDFLSISMPKRGGKLVEHNCPVLTPDGFKPHGELRYGDYVYGIDGKPVKVLYKHPDSYATHKVKFSSGEEILTSAEHEWLVYDRTRHDYRIVETQDMLKSGLTYGKDKRWRYLIPKCAPINMPDKELAVDPYVLGAWLGDGTTAKPLMTNAMEDAPIIRKMTKRGYPLNWCYKDKNYGTLVCTFTNKLSKGLRQYGMCHRKDKGNKHIPEEYLTASFKQRVELLSGLVDTDGYVEKGKHRVAISTILPRLRDDIIKLVSTFGLDCRCHVEKPHDNNSGIVGKHDVYIITFVPDFELLTVLERKQNVPTELSRRISVRSIEKLEKPVKGNCITVDGGVYRVGWRQILTHNSQLGLNFVNMISGLHPDKSTLMEGSGDALVNSFYQGCLEYIRQPSEYNFYDIFPESKLVQTNADTKIFNLVSPKRFPTVMCRSIDSTQVGLSEATNLLYLDDCVQGREEAKNRQRLDDKWEVISGDIIGRAIEGTPIVICGTRYSLYDPIGRLQDAMREQNKRMRIIETPALDPITDESNFEYERDGKKVFTTQYFRDQRNMLSAEQFESEFQQQPFEAKGLLFPEASLNRFFELPIDRDPDAIICVCDTAEKGSDFLSMPVAAIYGEEVYIIDVVFDDSPPNVTKPQVAKCIMNNNVTRGTFESNNAGEYYARDVQEILDKHHYKCSIKTKRTISNKQTRIEMASDNILKYFYFKDKSLYAPNSQYAFFIKQIITYTRSGKVPHDDAPDSLSLLENQLRTLGSNKIEIFTRPF